MILRNPIRFTKRYHIEKRMSIKTGTGHKNRAETWLMQLRVQFPSRQPTDSSVDSISHGNGYVNKKRKSPAKPGTSLRRLGYLFHFVVDNNFDLSSRGSFFESFNKIFVLSAVIRNVFIDCLVVNHSVCDVYTCLSILLGRYY